MKVVKLKEAPNQGMIKRVSSGSQAVKDMAGAVSDLTGSNVAKTVKNVANAVNVIAKAMEDGSTFRQAFAKVQKAAAAGASSVDWTDTKATAKNVSLHDGPSNVINTLRSLADKSAKSSNENSRKFSNVFNDLANKIDDILTKDGWWKIHNTVTESYKDVDLEYLLEDKKFMSNILYLNEALLKEWSMDDTHEQIYKTMEDWTEKKF